MDEIVIIGASGHARTICDAIEQNSNYGIHGLIDSFKEPGKPFYSYKILGDESILPELVKKGVTKGVVAIGDNWVRFQMVERIKKIAPNFEFINVIHPSAILSPKSTIGQGTVVLTAGIINVSATVGNFCIINTKSSLGHDAIMDDFSSLAPGVTIGGSVRIGKYSNISIGVNVIQNISIGDHTVIGAGSTVVNHIASNKLALGTPAKVVRNRKIGEKYLDKNQ
ncbi:acetyltransferase [Spongiivirga sp. MCCC 1A20706]|uniref:acetyltransferase n=1 Tax=Spongiivirga sp. MCCC 1A20706 TaxID=3160963 RepID=UPI0039778BD1